VVRGGRRGEVGGGGWKRRGWSCEKGVGRRWGGMGGRFRGRGGGSGWGVGDRDGGGRERVQ